MYKVEIYDVKDLYNKYPMVTNIVSKELNDPTFEFMQCHSVDLNEFFIDLVNINDEDNTRSLIVDLNKKTFTKSDDND